VAQHAFWIIVDGQTPTSFRSRQREDLLPTLHQLQRKQPQVRLLWFERGRLWATPTEAREALIVRRQAPTGRPRTWRPGGDHVDPRAKYEISRDQKRARFKARLGRDHRDDGPPADREPGPPPDRSPTSRGKTPPSAPEHAPFRSSGKPPARSTGRPPSRPGGSARSSDRKPPFPSDPRESRGDRPPAKLAARKPTGFGDRPWRPKGPWRPKKGSK
jgi:hypothetical protein